MTKKTGAQRLQKHRDSKRKQGFVLLQAWIKPEHRKRITQYIARLNNE